MTLELLQFIRDNNQHLQGHQYQINALLSSTFIYRMSNFPFFSYISGLDIYCIRFILQDILLFGLYETKSIKQLHTQCISTITYEYRSHNERYKWGKRVIINILVFTSKTETTSLHSRPWVEYTNLLTVVHIQNAELPTKSFIVWYHAIKHIMILFPDTSILLKHGSRS